MSWRGRGYEHPYLMHREPEWSTPKGEKYSEHYKAGAKKGSIAKVYSEFRDVVKQMYNFDMHTPPRLVYNSLRDALNRIVEKAGLGTDILHKDAEKWIRDTALDFWKLPYIDAVHVQPGQKRDFSKVRYETPGGSVQKQMATEAERAKRSGRKWL